MIHGTKASINQAVDFLMQKDYDLAIRELQSVMRQQQKATPSRQETKTDKQPSPSLSTRELDFSIAMENTGIFEIYKSCFLINSSTTSISSIASPSDDLQLESTIIIYNLALAQHVFGLQTGQSAALQKALKFYKIVIKLLKNMMGDDRYESIIGHILLASLNNMGHIHSVICDSKEIYRSLSLLDTTLVAVDTSSVPQQALCSFEMSVLMYENFQSPMPYAPLA